MTIPADYIPKCVEKLHSHICNKEDKVDELMMIKSMKWRKILLQ